MGFEGWNEAETYSCWLQCKYIEMAQTKHKPCFFSFVTLQFEKPGQSCRSLVWQSLCFNNRSRGRYDSFPNHHYLWQLKTNYCPVSEPARYLSLSSDMPGLWRKGEATSVLATAMLFSLKIFHHKVRWNKYPILNLSAIYSFLVARGKEGKASMYTNRHCIWIASSFFSFFPFFFSQAEACFLFIWKHPVRI